jgi:hypothetical protein
VTIAWAVVLRDGEVVMRVESLAEKPRELQMAGALAAWVGRMM